jgi:hypothetical protein
MKDIFNVAGFTWDGHTVLRVSAEQAKPCRLHVKARETISDLQDQRMRLERRLKAAEHRWANSADNVAPRHLPERRLGEPEITLDPSGKTGA